MQKTEQINSNTTWLKNTEHTGSKLLIPGGVELIVEEGAKISFDEIVLEGRMLLRGTSQNPIRLNSVVSADNYGSKPFLHAEHTEIKKNISINSSIELRDCIVSDGIFVRRTPGYARIENCSFQKNRRPLNLGAKNIYIKGCTFDTCIALFIDGNCEIRDNIFKNFTSSARGQDFYNAENASQELGLVLAQVPYHFSQSMIIENNQFMNMFRGITIKHRYRGSQALYLGIFIQNNAFENNKTDIMFYDRGVFSRINNNNFAGTELYNFISLPGSNSSNKKMFSETLKIGANYYTDGQPKVFDHSSNFNSIHSIKTAAPLPSPRTLPCKKISTLSFIKRKNIMMNIPILFRKMLFNTFGLLGFGLLCTAPGILTGGGIGDLADTGVLLKISLLVIAPILLFSLILPIDLYSNLKNFLKKLRV